MEKTKSQIITVTCTTKSMKTLKVVLKKLKTFTEIWSDDIEPYVTYEEEQYSIFKLGEISFFADDNLLRNSRFQFVLLQLLTNLRRNIDNVQFSVKSDL